MLVRTLVLVVPAIAAATFIPCGVSVAQTTVPVAATRPAAEVVHLQLQVAATNDEWTSTTYRIQPNDLIILSSQGQVKVGQFTAEVNADGLAGDGQTRGAGHLVGKVGTGAEFRVGSRYVFSSDTPGMLKVKVKDTRYDDNVGSFEVHLMVIPAALIPPARVVNTDE